MDTTTEIGQLSDEEVLKASIENPAYFSLIVDRYQAPLFRVAFNVVRQREEAEDIVQEAFTKIYLHAAKFEKQEGASFKSWAYRIAFNTSISKYRKLKRKFASETVLEVEHYENLSSEERVISEADAKLLTEKLLMELPVDLRRVMEKFYFEDKSYQTISAEEGISLSTLKMRLFRAKKILKGYYEGEY